MCGGRRLQPNQTSSNRRTLFLERVDSRRANPVVIPRPRSEHRLQCVSTHGFSLNGTFGLFAACLIGERIARFTHLPVGTSMGLIKVMEGISL